VNKYDPANWLKHSKESVYHTAKQGTLIKLDVEYLSPLLLVRWTRNNYKEPVFGFLEAEIISPLGNPSTTRQEFEVVTDKEHYQFWSVSNDGLPYRLHARLIQNPKLSTQLEIWEYTPYIQRLSTPETSIDMFTAPSTPPPEYKATFLSVPANIGAPMTLPPNALRGGGGRLINNTNKEIWVLESEQPIAAGKPAGKLAVGGNYDITDGYKGAVQTLIAPGGAPLSPNSSVDFTEFVQIN
jgi:hypothetical protein